MVHFPSKITPGANQIHETLHEDGMRIEKNLDIPLKDGVNTLRCDVFLPESKGDNERFPVIMTMGPYGKDVPYSVFYRQSYAELPDDQKSKWSAWEVVEPTYWTKQGYACIRVDELGSGQSPGYLDTMSDSTSSNFAEAIEWAADQPWSTGKIGLLGISYYAGSQWRVAARQPKGLACIIPWEGMGDYYRDRVRHGGILSNGFIKFWQERQINHNQYGTPGSDGSNANQNLPGMAPRPANVEGVLSAEQLRENRSDQTVDTADNEFLDDPYFASREYDLAKIQVPLLSVANWGGINLHLRGNILGYLGAGTPYKWLQAITGRHDLPFYLPECVAVQLSFFNTFLKGKPDNDGRNWLAGPSSTEKDAVPPVIYALRKGNPGFNKTESERTFVMKEAKAWPLPDTQYTDFFLDSKKTLSTEKPTSESDELTWQGLTGDSVEFSTEPFQKETEITGHPVFHCRVGVKADEQGRTPKDLDIFVTLRHYDRSGEQVFYTGTAGDPAPLCKGWLRVSHRKLAEGSTSWLLQRSYKKSDVQEVKADELYDVDVELWPTNVVVEEGGRLVLEVGPKDQQGCGITVHAHPKDRNEERHGGLNRLVFGEQTRLTLPIVPS